MNIVVLLVACILTAIAPCTGAEGAFRPPSVPLVAHDPYLSIWSPADRLSDADTVHWTGKPHRLRCLVRIDDQAYRLMGADPADVPALPQTSVTVYPTRTVCEFDGPHVAITLTFTSPGLPDDMDVLSRPLTYITWDIRSTDRLRHNVQVYFDASSELAVNTPDQTVVWNKEGIPGFAAARIGSERQPVLSARGDDRRIDWGYLYLAVPTGARSERQPGLAQSNEPAPPACTELVECTVPPTAHSTSSGQTGVSLALSALRGAVHSTSSVQAGLASSETEQPGGFPPGPLTLTPALSLKGEGAGGSPSEPLTLTPALSLKGEGAGGASAISDARMAIGFGDSIRRGFAEHGILPSHDDKRMPRAAGDEEPVIATVVTMDVEAGKPASRYLMLAYDDEYSINYFGRRLRPYWRRNGMDAAGLLKVAAKEYASIGERCRKFDERLMADAAKLGGEKYARICALCYRQCLAGNKLAADDKGMPMLFPKENTSNGCIGTVDVIFPMSPMFLLLSPGLSRAMLVPVLEYASSPRWKFAFSPHDLGCYPKATGQVYGGGENTEDGHMPVEESGDMIIMIAALCRAEGNCSFAERYWPMLSRWAEYLTQFGMDPAHQLCTDDFAGAFAHNVNLSAKAIIALGAYRSMCEQTGRDQETEKYAELVAKYVRQWMETAGDDDHTRLAFDRPGTWSQKYNLIWDDILDLLLFPPEVAESEAAFYRRISTPYGVPLDSRNTFAKLDWSVWAAALARHKDDFEGLIAPIYTFLNTVPQRNPVTDLYWTKDGKELALHARPVVGGVFIRMLQDPKVWRSWASKGAKAEGKWAPFPTPAALKTIVPTAQTEPIEWRFTTDKPADNWFRPDFDDSAWKKGPAGFGAPGTPGAVVRTDWTTPDIWIRREFDLTTTALKNPRLFIHHDEDAEVYINGILAAQPSGYTAMYEEADLTPASIKSLRAGKNTIAIHCRQTAGGQYVDAGIVGE